MNNLILQKEIRKQIEKFNCREFTVVQIGAGDGVTDDPVYRFWKHNVHWRGLFVEPVPYLNSKLITARGTDRAIILNITVRDFNGSTDFFYLDEGTKGPWWRYGFASTHSDVYFKHGWAFKNGLTDKTVKDVRKCVTINTLFDLAGIKRCDWLVIDVEGAEWDVFCHFDQMPDKPRLILFEHKHLTSQENLRLQKFLTSRNYQFFVYAEDTLAYL